MKVKTGVKAGLGGEAVVSEENVNPHDKIGMSISKKMGSKTPFKKGDSKTNTVKQNESNMNPYDKIAAMMGKKMGVKSPFKKGDSRTNTVKQEIFDEMEEPDFKLPTLDQYAKAAEHVPVHPLETRKGKKVEEGEAPNEQENLKDVKAKQVLKDASIRPHKLSYNQNEGG